ADGVYPSLVEDDREFVSLLESEEVHAPSENVFHFARNACRHPGGNRGIPQRIVRLVYLRRLPAAYHVYLLALLTDRYRIARERYHDVVRRILFIYEVAQPLSERIVFHEGRVELARTHAAHVEYRSAGAVDAVNLRRSHTEPAEDVRQRLSAAYPVGNHVVVFVFDAVHQVGCRLFLFGNWATLLRRARTLPCAEYDEQYDAGDYRRTACRDRRLFQCFPFDFHYFRSGCMDSSHSRTSGPPPPFSCTGTPVRWKNGPFRPAVPPRQ